MTPGVSLKSLEFMYDIAGRMSSVKANLSNGESSAFFMNEEGFDQYSSYNGESPV